MGSGCVGNCEGAVRPRKSCYVVLRDLSRSRPCLQMDWNTSVRERSGSAVAISGTSYPEDHVEGTAKVDRAPEVLAASGFSCRLS